MEARADGGGWDGGTECLLVVCWLCGRFPEHTRLARIPALAQSHIR